MAAHELCKATADMKEGLLDIILQRSIIQLVSPIFGMTSVAAC